MRLCTISDIHLRNNNVFKNNGFDLILGALSTTSKSCPCMYYDFIQCMY